MSDFEFRFTVRILFQNLKGVFGGLCPAERIISLFGADVPISPILPKL